MPRSFASPVRRRTLLGGALAWSAVTVAAPFPVRARGEAPIKFGMVEPLTGAYGKIAQAEVDGARLALEEVNRTGGILGREVRAPGRGFRQRRRHRRCQNHRADRSRSGRFHPRQRQLRGRARHGAGHEGEAQASYRHRRAYRRNHRIALPLECVSHLQVGDHGSQRHRRHADREIRQEMVFPHARLRLRLRAASGVRTKTPPAWRRMGWRSYSARHRRFFALPARCRCLSSEGADQHHGRRRSSRAASIRSRSSA